MRVLLTNDDGIYAPGIEALYDALVGVHPGGPESSGTSTRFGGIGTTILPVAPLTVQSATSHGVTFHTPLMVRDTESATAGGHTLRGIAVDARPADCVKLALTNLWPDRFGAGSRPDLAISGMNAGANCGINTIYSGTVAAALEAAFLGVPSIAVSMMLGKGKPNFAVAAQWARHTLDRLIAKGLPRAHECLSINIPPAEGLPAGSPPPPIRVCPMNVHGLTDKYERRTSPLGEVYYWAAGHGLDFRGTDAGSDVDLLMRGNITVTPLCYDLTRHADVDRWAERLG